MEVVEVGKLMIGALTETSISLQNQLALPKGEAEETPVSHVYGIIDKDGML